MRYLLVTGLLLLLTGCGAADQVMDGVETTTEKLQPVADTFQTVCIKARLCLDAAGEDTAEIEQMCREGWEAFKIIKAIQETAVTAAGGEPE